MEDPNHHPEVAGEEEGERLTLLQRIGRLSGAEKIQVALKGNQEERLILIRDSNKSVARAVLESPRLTDHEIEAYASLRDVSEEVLRKKVKLRVISVTASEIAPVAPIATRGP